MVEVRAAGRATRPRTHLSPAQARRVAVAAQGLDRARPTVPTMRHLTGVVQRTGVLQVDSVNVLARAHLMPVFSRLGAYDTALLTRAAEQRPRRLVEYWAHCQALVPVDLWPVLAFRRQHYREQRGKWGMSTTDRSVVEVLAALRDRGASTAGALDDGAPRARDHWGWNWSEARKVLDRLALTGEVVVAGRNPSFEPVYDLAERVLPAGVLDAEPLPAPDAVRELVRRAAASHGVAGVRELTDHYRLQHQRGQGQAVVRTAVAELVEAGELLPVAVQGWGRPAWLHAGARVPRSLSGRALLSPFDPLVWERQRTAEVFDFDYRIEIYVPADQRRFGYYVLPFLLDDELVARVDLKADRRADGGAGVLRVPGAYAEPGRRADREQVATALAQELGVLADWLDLGRVEVADRGDLAPDLRRLCARPAPGPATP